MEIKHTIYILCPYCKGKKKINDEECEKCHGTGRIKKLYTGKFYKRKTLL